MSSTPLSLSPPGSEGHHRKPGRSRFPSRARQEGDEVDKGDTDDRYIGDEGDEGDIDRRYTRLE